MPRMPTLRVRALNNLARQLRFESREAARRQLVRAESLAVELLGSPGEAGAARGPGTFPASWVVWRITGLKVEEEGGEPELLVREALLGDLPALIDRLSAAAEIGERELDDVGAGEGQGRRRGGGTAAVRGPWLGVEEVCARWRVSRKTLERYRRLGLIGRRVMLGRGRWRVVFAETVVRAFEGRHTARVVEAGGFARMGAAERARVIESARRMRAGNGSSLHACAARIAEETGRSTEAIRRILAVHDERSAEPIFGGRGPLTEHERRVLERGAARGGKVAEAARRVGKSRSSVYRVLHDRRAARLRGLDLSGADGPTFARSDAAEVLLGPASVRSGLGGPGVLSAAGVIREAAGIAPASAAAERAMAVAYRYLLYRARVGIGGLARHGARAGRTGADAGAAGLDRIETDLLWAARIKAELVRQQLPLLVRTVEAGAGRGAAEMDVHSARGMIEVAMEALGAAIDRHDPFKGGRVAGGASVAMGRAVSQWLGKQEGGAPGRAVRSVRERAPEDWTLRVCVWQEFLEPGPGVRGRCGELANAARHVVEMRMGWDGGPPRTPAEIAEELGTTAGRVAATLRRAVAAAGDGKGGA